MMHVRFSLRQFFLFVAACALLSAVVPFFITGYHDRWTCALCRSDRIDYVYLGRNWQTETRETSCSRWYQQNIEPNHDHIWVHGRASAIRDLYGNRYGAIDRDPAGRTIWRLTPEDQLSLYQHIPNSADAKSVFTMLASPTTKTNNQDFEILNNLLAWKESDFTSSWHAPSTP